MVLNFSPILHRIVKVFEHGLRNHIVLQYFRHVIGERLLGGHE